MIKKSTLFTLLVIFFSWGVQAQMSDGFDYVPGTAIDANGSAGGGWANAWTAVSDQDTSFIGAGGVFNDSLLVRTENNRAVIVSTTDQNRYQRLFTDPITSADGEFWFSAHLAIDGNPAGNVGTISLIDTSQANMERITVGKRFGNRNVFATGAGSGATNTGQFFTGRAARWLVGHVTYNATDNNWQLDMWVDPDPSATPQEADAQIMNKAYPLATFHALRLKSEGAPGILFSVDDVYIGSAFTDVVPGDLIAITAKPDGAQEKMAYTAGEQLAGKDGGEGFDGPWTLVTGTDPDITDDGITSMSLNRKTSGNKVSASANTRIVRSLEGSYGDNGRTYWVSWWFQTENAGGNVSHLVLADKDALGASGPDGRLAQIGSGFNATNIGLVGGGTTGAATAEGHFVVLEVVTNGSAANDQIYIYIDPDPATAPSRDMADAQGARNLTNWNAIALLVEGGAGVTAMWDDIYVGNSYTDVVPDDLIDITISTSALAFDQFDYDAGMDVLGLGGAVNGWAADWDTIASAPDANAVIATGGVANDQLMVKTATNSFQSVSTGSGNRYIRLFETPLTADDNEEFWFSAHMAVSGDVGNNVGTFILVDTSFGGAYERIILGKRFGNRNAFATGPGAGPTNSGKFFEGNSARWLVGKMVASDTSDNWILQLWVDPDPSAMPDTANADIKNKLYPLSAFNGVSVKTEGAAGLITEVDDIFFGNTFDDVVPANLEVIPAAPDGASDPLNYTAGEGLDGKSGGEGWDGNWTLVADDDPQITAGGIQNFELLKETSGTKATFTSNGRIMRKLAGEYGDNGRTFWVGFWFDSENGGPNVTNLVLADSENFAAGAAGELLQIGRSFNGTNLRIIGQGETMASADEGHFVVLELVTNGVAANDEVYMWVDPALDKTPSRDSADVKANANLTNWDAIGLKVAGDPGVTAMWDDIYVGSLYADVTPDDLLDVQPPDVPVVAYEAFDYTSGEDLDMQAGGEGWQGPWSAEAGSITIAAGSIDSDRVDGEGNKASVQQSADAVTYTRPYFARFAADNPNKNTLWVSFLMDVTQNSIGNLGNVALMDGTEEIIAVGAPAGLGNFAVTYNGNDPLIDPSQSVEGINWVVMQLDLYGSGVVDTARIWINPVSDALPMESNALFVITDLEVDNGFDNLRITASGAQMLDMFVDEIYTGFEFRDVSPNFGSDDPDLLAYEPFNYDAGQSLFGLGGVNAFWDGVWMDAGTFGDVNELQITDGSIEVSGFETIGNKAQFSYLEEATTIRADRELAFPMTSDGRTYWVTYFINTTEGRAINNVGNVTLRNSAIGQANGQRLSIGRLYGGGKLGFVTPATGNNRPTEIDDAGLHWMVARISTNADVAIPDTVWLWIDPPANVEPDTANALVSGISDFMKAGPIDIIRIRTEGAAGDETPYITNFDELRIATAWEAASSFTTGVSEPLTGDQFKLGMYPNPFQTEVNIEFELPTSGLVTLELHDLQGRRVANVLTEQRSAGEHTVQYQAGALPDGIYLLRLMHEGQSSTRKLILFR